MSGTYNAYLMYFLYNTPSQFDQMIMQAYSTHRFCVAPMMDWTDRHCRYFLRLFTKHTLLYTEMVTTGALLYGDAERFLRFNAAEQPVALQLGGSDPDELAKAAIMGEQAGYQEINLNSGCPSDRVQRGKIGACLMAEPTLVAECMAAMKEAVAIPVTIKCRIGIDEIDSLEHLSHFVETVSATGCHCFIIHARIAVLAGLSPKQNREIPPLDYERVFAIKERFPDLEIVINGGIKTLEESRHLLENVDGVMIGREAYQNPNLLARVDQQLFDSDYPVMSQEDVLAQFIDYAKNELRQGTALKNMTRHVLGLFQGQPGAKRFRRYLSENAHKQDAGIDILETAGRLVLNSNSLMETPIQEVLC
jgi:tRNA-dihydrouridine synthase A